jgi:hypothetical protein
VYKRRLIVICFIVSLFGSSKVSAEDRIDMEVTADYLGKYIWRGQNINDESVLQPSISLSKWGFTGSIWGNIDLTNNSQTAPDNAWEFSEFDYSLDYTAAVPDVNWVSFSVGTIHYEFPNTGYSPTTEIYVGLSLNVSLSPSFKWYRDVDEIDGSYFQFGLGHTFEKIMEMGEKFCCDLELGASVGCGNSAYNDGYFGADSGRFNDFTFLAALPVCIGSWTIKPSVNYSTMLSDEIRGATAKTDNIWVGVGLSKSF